MNNPLIKEHNEKVEQLHELLEWFENEYKDYDEISKNVQDAKNASLKILKLIQK